ncbi:hypothetical protein Hanom_Chr10g00929901 [Helianthus anomalus]
MLQISRPILLDRIAFRSRSALTLTLVRLINALYSNNSFKLTRMEIAYGWYIFKPA